MPCALHSDWSSASRTLFACTCLLIAPVSLHAQAYPEKPITLVIPFGPGGSTDIVGRTLGRGMQEQLGKPVVIINRPGAGGNVGAESVARAAPDGYTLLFGSTALVISPAIGAHLRYDVLKDLSPISQITVAPNVLVVHPSVSVRSVKDLIALARARPGELTASFGGLGTANHLGLALFNGMAGVNIIPVPYNNNAQAVIDVVSGYVAMAMVPMAAVVALVDSGRLRALGVTTRVRSPAMPRVPTLSEAGVPGYEASSWTGLLATGGTPMPIVNRLHAAVVAAMSSAAVKEALAKAGTEPVGGSPQAFARALRDDIAKYSKVARQTGIKPE
ncbi:MAG: tripartite tricarboxylate transporter substrate binding protein [Burkholderiales bacterium]|nr:tripartite tricarboxylate transporter substrate binding protein [Burkholderiales bacterium]